jgi:hypothetical protein
MPGSSITLAAATWLAYLVGPCSDIHVDGEVLDRQVLRQQLWPLPWQPTTLNTSHGVHGGGSLAAVLQQTAVPCPG